ncbi:MAG: hypothetical protein ABIN67_02125 [Ferruginibacter sp.]
MIKKSLLKIYKVLSNTRAGLFLLNKKFSLKYSSASQYWEQRYQRNGSSGPGSYGNAATYKAAILNGFVKEHVIESVIEFGCGDGNQLKCYEFESYIGLDVASFCIQKCEKAFKFDDSKSFLFYEPFVFNNSSLKRKAQLVLSIDVIYHLLEDEVYQLYMQHIFDASEKYVIIYAWDIDEPQKEHVRHRKFSHWIKMTKKNWRLFKHIASNPKGVYCDFYIYEKCDS